MLKRFVDGAAFPLPERHARWMGSFTAEQRAELLLPDVRAELWQRGAALDATKTHPGAHALRNPLNQVLYLDMKLYLEGDILVKTDRASMMTSLEARVPLLNADMVDYATSLPLSRQQMSPRALWSGFPVQSSTSASPLQNAIRARHKSSRDLRRDFLIQDALQALVHARPDQNH